MPIQDLLLEIAPIPTAPVAELALEFGSVALSDVRSARILYARGYYSQSIFLLQQSVEKASKGFGLLMGAVQPDAQKMYSIGHAPLRVLRSSSEFQKRIDGAFRRMLTLPESTLPRFIRTTIAKMSDEAQSAFQSQKAVENDLHGLNQLALDRLWVATLRLDESVPEVKNALSALNNSFNSRSIQMLVRYLSWASKSIMKGNREYSDYVLSVARSSARIYPLNFLTMWHVQGARYPSVGPIHYGSPSEYTKEQKLVRTFPRLAKNTEALCNEVSRASTLALKMNVSMKTVLARIREFEQSRNAVDE